MRTFSAFIVAFACAVFGAPARSAIALGASGSSPDSEVRVEVSSHCDRYGGCIRAVTISPPPPASLDITLRQEDGRGDILVESGSLELSVVATDAQSTAVCAAVDRRSVRCMAVDLGAITVNGRGQDDRVNASGLIDRAAVLNGEGGADRLLGGPLGDVIRGGAGNDVLDGGGGGDVLDLSDQQVPVRADLRRQRVVGGDGTGDQITRFSGAIGGAGDDRLQAGAAASHLDGGDGNDVLRGGVGDDWLSGGPGPIACMVASATTG